VLKNVLARGGDSLRAFLLPTFKNSFKNVFKIKCCTLSLPYIQQHLFIMSHKKKLLNELQYVFADNPRALQLLAEASEGRKTVCPVQAAVKGTFYWVVERCWWALFQGEERQQIAVQYLRRQRYKRGDQYPPKPLLKK
jgi:hypothetical protein